MTRQIKQRGAIVAALSLCAWTAAMAQTAVADDPAVKRCAQIGAAADRLACYDAVAGRASAQEAVRAALPASAPAPTSKLAPVDVHEAAALPRPASEGGLMSKFWELEPADKRGVFNFTGYHPNYILPVHWTTSINRSPQSPTQQAVQVPAYRHLEAKVQLSLRTKLAQDLMLAGGDVWAAYTQQSFWQVYNGHDSKPFRNTDYEAEVMYVLPVPQGWSNLPFGWRWRYGQAAIAHQSNGQSDPLSRSWNRAYLGTGFERGDVGLNVRAWRRFREDLSNDNNPDLTDYRGRAEAQLTWTPGAHTASLLVRSNLKNLNRGAAQFEYTTPVFSGQPNGVRWYFQLFTGYGETLTDYNFRQTSLGLGLTFLQF